MKNRRSLTPLPERSPNDDVHATRRGGARHELSARVLLKPAFGGRPPPAAPMPDAEPEASLDDAAAAGVIEGWALNVSRGGLRVILEHRVDLGAEFEITICEVGAEPTSPQPGRVVWIQDEPDGVIAGIEFRVPSGGATG